MRGEIKTGVYPASGSAKCLYRAEVSPDSVYRFSEPTSRMRPTGALKKVLFQFAIIIALFVAGGCAEIQIPPRDQSTSQFNVYFNNDNLTDGMTVCKAVFPVPRSSPSTTNGPAAALEALFVGPTPEERSQGYRSFFSGRTAGLLKRLKTEAGTAYVDLHDKRREFSGVTSSCGSAEFFSQIQRTLEEFPTIDRIIFAIEGSPRVFYEWMELECDLTNDNCAPGSFAPP